MCRACIYDDSKDKSPLMQIDECQCYRCPLYQVRPVSMAHKNKLVKLKLAEMSPAEKITYDANVFDLRLKIKKLRETWVD